MKYIIQISSFIIILTFLAFPAAAFGAEQSFNVLPTPTPQIKAIEKGKEEVDKSIKATPTAVPVAAPVPIVTPAPKSTPAPVAAPETKPTPTAVPVANTVEKTPPTGLQYVAPSSSLIQDAAPAITPVQNKSAAIPAQTVLTVNRKSQLPVLRAIQSKPVAVIKTPIQPRQAPAPIITPAVIKRNNSFVLPSSLAQLSSTFQYPSKPLSEQTSKRLYGIAGLLALAGGTIMIDVPGTIRKRAFAAKTTRILSGN